ncbi:MAG: hypothetical protein NVSMB66_6500 [Candidatus Doudnabacteria bacterium]
MITALSMDKKLKQALKEHMRKLAIKGGKALAKKRGTEYYREIVNKRWAKHKKAVDKKA